MSQSNPYHFANGLDVDVIKQRVLQMILLNGFKAVSTKLALYLNQWATNKMKN